MSSSNPDYDWIIIGGGILGAFHAYHALEQGMRVAVIEKSCQPRGATTRNFGQVVPSGLDQSWQGYGRESLSIYKQIQGQFPISVRQLGSIYIASDEEELTLIEELHAINLQNDYPSEVWSTERCKSRYPQLRGDYCKGGLFFPEELSVNPNVMIHRLWEFLSDHPLLETRFRTCATQVETSDDGKTVSVLTSGNQRFTGHNAVICNGSDFRCLLPSVFHESDLQLVKLQMLRLSPQTNVDLPGNILTGLSIRRYESFSQCPSWHEIKKRENDHSFAKQWGVHILLKQEEDGRIILGDSHEYLPAANNDAFSCELRDDINDFFVKEASKIFELTHWDIESSWAGVYCQTQDPSGIFRRTIDDRIHVVTGIGGKGMTSSAGFAKHHLEQLSHQVGA